MFSCSASSSGHPRASRRRCPGSSCGSSRTSSTPRTSASCRCRSCSSSARPDAAASSRSRTDRGSGSRLQAAASSMLSVRVEPQGPKGLSGISTDRSGSQRPGSTHPTPQTPTPTLQPVHSSPRATGGLSTTCSDPNTVSQKHTQREKHKQEFRLRPVPLPSMHRGCPALEPAGKREERDGRRSEMLLLRLLLPGSPSGLIDKPRLPVMSATVSDHLRKTTSK